MDTFDAFIMLYLLSWRVKMMFENLYVCFFYCCNEQATLKSARKLHHPNQLKNQFKESLSWDNTKMVKYLVTGCKTSEK